MLKSIPPLKETLEQWATLWAQCNEYEPRDSEDIKKTYLAWRSSELALYAAVRGIPFDPEEWKEEIERSSRENAEAAASWLQDYAEYCERRRNKEAAENRAQQRLKREESLFLIESKPKVHTSLRLHKGVIP